MPVSDGVRNSDEVYQVWDGIRRVITCRISAHFNKDTLNVWMNLVYVKDADRPTFCLLFE